MLAKLDVACFQCCCLVSIATMLVKFDHGLILHECLKYSRSTARVAQSAERKALNLVVVGSSPTVGVFSFFGNANTC